MYLAIEVKPSEDVEQKRLRVLAALEKLKMDVLDKGDKQITEFLSQEVLTVAIGPGLFDATLRKNNPGRSRLPG
jgi:hypothetical protein